MPEEENFDWISAGEAFRPTVTKKAPPPPDPYVSKILGFPVAVNDPRLMRLVVQFKRKNGTSPESDKMDNFLYDPEFLTELRKTFGVL